MWEALQALSLQAGAFCWSLVLVLKWIHAQFVQPAGRMLADTLLPVWEESLRASAEGPVCACRAGLASAGVASGERSAAVYKLPSPAATGGGRRRH